MNRIYRTGQGDFILLFVLVDALVVKEKIAQALLKGLINFLKFVVVLDHRQICFAVLLYNLEGENLILAFENLLGVVVYGQQGNIVPAIRFYAVKLLEDMLLTLLVNDADDIGILIFCHNNNLSYVSAPKRSTSR